MGNLHRKKRKERQRGRRQADDAWEAADTGDLEVAERRMRAALKGHEDDPVLWNDLALVLWKRGLPKDAEKAFRNAVLIRPGYEDALMNLAALLASRGFYRQALRIEEELAASGSPRREYHEKMAEEYRAQAEKRSAEGDPDAGDQGDD
jgi:Flp pilus assembly protein TadD